MILTGAKSSQANSKTNVTQTIKAKGIADIGSNVVKAGSDTAKKRAAQNYINTMVQNYNKSRQESI